MLDSQHTSRESAWVKEAARKALANRENAGDYLTEARDKLRATITNPLDDTSLEGLEDYLEEKPQEETAQMESTDEMTDEELYEQCEECHIANAVAAASTTCEIHPQSICRLIEEKLDREDIQPEEWLKVLIEATDKATGEAKRELAMITNDLLGYLERRDSPFLKKLTETA